MVPIMNSIPNQDKQQFFDRYAQNWAYIHPEDGVIFVCPLCLDPKATSGSEEFTVDHVPPQSLGGTNAGFVLTCTKCNNTSGILEGRLGNWLKVEDFMLGIPNTVIEGEYTPIVDDNILLFDEKERWPVATFIKTVEGWSVFGDPLRSNPKLKDEIISTKLTGRITGFKGRRIQRKAQNYEGSPSIALLKTAYLYLFRTFGYGVLMSSAMRHVQEQIQSPAKMILPRTWILEWDFPDQFLGVNVILEPHSWRSFLIVFDLDSGKRKRRFGVILPRPDDLGLEVYNHLDVDAHPCLKIANIQEDDEFLTDQGLCFYVHQIWL